MLRFPALAAVPSCEAKGNVGDAPVGVVRIIVANIEQANDFVNQKKVIGNASLNRRRWP